MTNLIFESSKSWDLLCDVSTGRMVVSKDISTTCPYSPPPTLAPHLSSRGALKAESSVGSEEEFGKLRSDHSSSKSENYDNLFMEDVRLSIPRTLPCEILLSSRLWFRSSRPSHIILERASSGLDSRITFGDLFGLLHDTTRKLTDQRSRVGRLRVTLTVGTDHG